MKLKASAAVAAIVAGAFGVALLSAPAEAQSYSRLVVFGDSLSDNGNLTFFASAPPPPYYNGRFSNGPVWVERLGFNLQPFFNNVTLLANVTGSDDWAFGGARTDTAVFIPPGIPDQITDYKADGGTFSSSTLVTLWGGANDFFQAVGVTCSNPTCTGTIALTAAGNMGASAATISSSGAGTILIPNLPNLGVTPAFSSNPAQPLAVIYTNTFNQALAADIAVDAAAHPNTNFILMDVNTAFQYVLAHPATFGFTDVTTACTSTLACAFGSPATQNSHIFWDSVHPTAAGHIFLAELATEYLYYGNFGVATAAEGETSLRHRGQSLDNAMGMIQARSFEGGQPSVGGAVEGDSSTTNARDGGLMPKVRDRSGGGAVWLTVPVSEHLRWGAQMSGQQSDVKAGALSFRDLTAAVDLYGGWRGSSGMFFNAAAGAGVDQFTDIKRVTAVAPLVNTASTNGWSASAKVQGGWYFDLGAATLSPRAAVAVAHGDVEAYEEDGAMVREGIAQRQIDTTSGEATLRLESPMGGSMHAYVEAGYRDYFSYKADAVTVSLPGNTAHALSTAVGRPDGGIAVIDAGLSGQVGERISIGVGYRGRHSGSYSDDMGGIGIKMKF
jgi:outer membrane lipase/esterase